MSFRSQASPTHHCLRPRSSVVTLHAQTKQLRPALLASLHAPRPEHEFVAFVQVSAVSWHVETPPMGCCGDGPGAGRGDCAGGWSWRLSTARAGNDIMARVILGFDIAEDRSPRVVSAASSYCSLLRPCSTASCARPVSSNAPKTSSSSDSTKDTSDDVSARNVSVAEEGLPMKMSMRRGNGEGGDAVVDEMVVEYMCCARRRKEDEICDKSEDTVELERENTGRSEDGMTSRWRRTNKHTVS